MSVTVMSICADCIWNSFITLACFAGAICWKREAESDYISPKI